MASIPRSSGRDAPGSLANALMPESPLYPFAPSPLLAWYRAHKRDLPWRRREEDPYAVWVSEVMLQQTQVATVIPYYDRWLARFPTVQALAGAPLEGVLRIWEGLGYYARARNLHRAAGIVGEKHGGRIPDDPVSLASLPGIGRYTAGAILSIAFNQRAPIVDANVTRVLCRVFAIWGDPKSSANQRRLWKLAESLIPEGKARDFNQALMEVGALICTPADPACERCPLLSSCRAGNSPDPTDWPETLPGKATVREVHASAVVPDDTGRLLLVRRPPHGLWGGLWEFPRRVCERGESPSECAVRAAREVAGVRVTPGDLVATVKHSVTHHAITLHGIIARPVWGDLEAQDCAEVIWAAPQDIVALPLSAPQRLLADAVRLYIEQGRTIAQPALEIG